MIQNLGQYYDLYVQGGTLLADLFERFLNKCIKIDELDSGPGLSWQVCLKKTKAELELLAEIDILLTVEKGILDRMYFAVHRHAKANNKYVKDHDSSK